MKFLKSFIVMTLLSAAAWSYAADAAGDTNYVTVPFDFSVFPMISTAGFTGIKTIDIVQLNILAGYTSRLMGLQAGIFDLAGEDISGVQAAAVLSYSGGGSTGFQCAGAANFTAGEVIGVQSSGAFNYAGSVYGGQFGIINFSAGPASFQAGNINFAGGDNYAQAGVVNFAGGFGYFQAGVLNIVAGENYFQAGVVNVSISDSNRVQIGVVNYSEDPGLRSHRTGKLSPQRRIPRGYLV